MHKKFIIILLLTLAIFAGVFSFTAYAEEVKPWDVVATITSGNDSYLYCMSKYITKANSCIFLGGSAKQKLYNKLIAQGLDNTVVAEYILPGFSQLLQHFSYLNRPKIDATVVVEKGRLSYTNGRNGTTIDVDKLVQLLLASNGVRINVKVPIITSLAVQQDDLKRITVQKSTFVTYFNNDNINRVHNIKMAVQALDGTVVQSGQTFSFNKTVGCRTVANGYKVAKVISQGAYTDGVGGGVCQVSTTLYNALLLAGFTPKACSHSLVPNYVLPAFDAMVSDNVADLSFVNTTKENVYICASVGKGYLSFSIYGVSNQYRIERVCQQTRTPFETVEQYATNGVNQQCKVIQNGSDGVTATAYLQYYLGDSLVKTLRLRTVTYKKVDKIIKYE